MSDSFADLWKSSVPVAPPSSGIPNSRPKPQQQQQQKPSQGKDVFALLAASNPRYVGQGNVKAPSPAPSSSPRPSRPQNATNQKSSAGLDAFSDLFSVSSNSSSLSASPSLASSVSGLKNNTRLTIAQQAERQRQTVQKQQQLPQSGGGSSVWDFDALTTSTGMNGGRAVNNKNVTSDDDWGLGDWPTPTTKASGTGSGLDTRPTKSQTDVAPLPNTDDDWDLDLSAPIKQPQPIRSEQRQKSQGQRQTGKTLWEIDDLVGGTSSPAVVPSPRPASPSEPFDFGSREDSYDNDGEEDILGVLAKPVDSIPKRSIPPHKNAASPIPSSNSQPSPPSPPPHILGQIVEMGFSVSQARSALRSTPTGVDVQAALEMLLGEQRETNEANAPAPPRRDRDREREHTRVEVRATPPPTSFRDGEPEVGLQADKLIAQASEIGLSVLSKATSFWKEGKERVQRVYEERSSGSSSPAFGSGRGSSGAGAGPRRGMTSNTAVSGRPKWMQEDLDIDKEEEGSAIGLYNDSKRTAENSFKPDPPVVTSSKTVNLFGEDAPAPSVYASPFRHGKSRQATTSRSTPSPSQSNSQTNASYTPPLPPRPPPVITTRTALRTANSHRTRGTSLFKLGQFPTAAEAYTVGLDTLPSGHRARVPLLTNRAVALMRCGEYVKAEIDCEEVVALVDSAGGIGVLVGSRANINGNRREGQDADEGEGGALDGSDIDLVSGLVKAVKRRAEAREAREKWADALSDWEMLAGADWAGGIVRAEAVRGAARCREITKASQGGDIHQSPTIVKPKPKPPKPAAKPASFVTPKAVTTLRAANNAASAEDTEKHVLKDSVDAQLRAWRGGKEGNIRALLASVDTVLWEGLVPKGAGMSELVSNEGVKKRYMRVIGRVHPDKLNSTNSTLEQRMIANGVFSTLNEAWNSFRQ